MQATPKDKLSELQSIISKMTLEVCCQAVLPEVGVRWRDVTKAVRKARAPMTSASVARILIKHIANTMDPEQIDEIVSILRIKLVAASSGRKWYTIELLEQIWETESVDTWSRRLCHRVTLAARHTIKEYNTRVQVHSSQIGDFIFLSVQKVSPRRAGAPLYVAACPGQPVAFVSSLGCASLLRAAVEGLGYKKYLDADLHGRDLTSLLQIIGRPNNVQIDQLADIPEYDPQPVITKNGIDYTTKTYNEQYVDSIIGPEPPLINSLDIQSKKPFFDPSKSDKVINVNLTIKSVDIARTIKSLVGVKAIVPTSEIVKMFHQLKTNSFTYNVE